MIKSYEKVNYWYDTQEEKEAHEQQMVLDGWRINSFHWGFFMTSYERGDYNYKHTFPEDR